MTKIIDGKALAIKIKSQIAVEVKRMVDLGVRPPCLAVILVGDDAASAVYVRNKKRIAKKLVFARSNFCMIQQ